MNTLKSLGLSVALFASTMASAQLQDVHDSTNTSLQTTLAHNDYYVANRVSTDGLPTYENPRKNSIADLVKNQGIQRGYYKDANGRYVQFHPKLGSKKGYITVKFCDANGFVVDKFDIDEQFAPAKTFLNGSRSKAELDSFVSYCLSVPLKDQIVFVIDN